VQCFLLILGRALIIKSADILIDSAAKIARLYGVSSFVVGITVIAFGTSAPELAVGIISGFSKPTSSRSGTSSAVPFRTLRLSSVGRAPDPSSGQDSIVRRELPMLFAIQLLMCLMLIFDQRVSRPDALILLFCFAAFMVYITRGAKQSMAIRIDAEGDIDTDLDGNGIPAALAGELSPSEKNDSLLKLWLLSLLSLAGLFVGGRLTVSSSVNIAESLGLDQTLIGLTVVSLATTMPELITSIVAVRKKEPDIVLGNCIGSILFNIMLVLGASALIHPITVEADIRFDLTAMMAVTVILLTISAFSKKLSRPAGLLFLFLFFGYLTVKVMTALGT
jgi:cation:H+ antiporter